jgi:prevent-host-death family protein
MKTMAAGSFKAKCLAVMDEVQAKHETVVITKHGKPVVKPVPVSADADDIYNFLAGNVGSPARVTSDISQKSGRSHYRCYCARRGSSIAYCRS